MSEVRCSFVSRTWQADKNQYQRLKARALELQREKEYELKRELARKAEKEQKAAKEEAEVGLHCTRPMGVARRCMGARTRATTA